MHEETRKRDLIAISNFNVCERNVHLAKSIMTIDDCTSTYIHIYMLWQMNDESIFMYSLSITTNDIILQN